MAARESRERVPVHGMLLLDKPAGMTSNGALQRVKRLLGARKAGHTGSLDPAATGMLPLCFGEATKICAFLLDADKTYRVTARLGTATDTGDADGRVTAESAVPDLDTGTWRAVLQGFCGTIDQVPPMYSALKKDGQRLYRLARQGREVEREARQVTIHGIALTEARGDRLVFRVRCSKGTYVRTLVEDIAAAAGSLAHTAALHRESVAAFSADAMRDLRELEQLAGNDPQALRAMLTPPDLALPELATERLGGADAERFTHGQTLLRPAGGAGLVRVYGPGQRFLGVAERDAAGSLSPRRLFNLPD